MAISAGDLQVGPLHKKRLYEAYVSSGQARLLNVSSNAEILLTPRKAHIRRIISKHVPPKGEKPRILDLGCGHGAFLYFLSQAGYEDISGVDGSAEQVAIAHQLGIPRVQHAEIQPFVRAIASSSADVVLLMDVLEHLAAEELFPILDDVLRVLRPGGRCLAHVPNAEGVFGMRIRYGDFTHERAFTRSSLEQVFHTVGFNHVACFEDKPVIHGPQSAIRRLLWEAGTLPFRLLLAAETPCRHAILSQNLLLKALR